MQSSLHPRPELSRQSADTENRELPIHELRRRHARFSILLLIVLFAACGSSTGPEGTEEEEEPPLTPPPGIGTWTTLAPMPDARTENSVVSLDGRIYVAGGFGVGAQLLSDFLIYDPDEDTWSHGANVPEGRHHAALAAYDGKVYFLGGYTGASFDSWTPRDNLYIYDVGSDEWSEGEPMPLPRGAHAAAVTDDGFIHVVGGVGPSGPSDPVGEHHVYDIQAGTWSTAPPMPSAREHLGAAYYDGNVYVAGGRVPNFSALVTFQRYDTATQQWLPLSPVPTGRSGIAVAAFEGHIYVFGGESFDGPARTFDEAERYDPDTDTWEAVLQMPTARHGMGAGVTDEGIYVIGGGPQAGLTYSAINERWTP